METLTIKSPADLLSFIGHSLGFWPQESLVCITVDTDRLGATLRVDLPRHDGGELGYARTVAGHLTHDPNATAVLFAVYTSTPWDAGQPKPRAALPHLPVHAVARMKSAGTEPASIRTTEMGLIPVPERPTGRVDTDAPIVVNGRCGSAPRRVPGPAPPASRVACDRCATA
ncbi:DUF4192 family protein, partial [Arthrobacter sp. Soil736]|uniref:DUF4192 family protein n=1 Tax=Arthrobacter sp. Soil736 TaxID=1736395 RepID=UPI0012F8F400